jgi:uncharacterized protein YutE (UPF0331/DUF86 family)
MTIADQEAQVLRFIVPKLEAEGYEVLVDPPATRLPEFMQSYRPDAIALGSPKNLAIEVVLEGSTEDFHLAALRKRFRDSKDWELRVYYASPSHVERQIEVASQVTIEQSLKVIRELIDLGQYQPALLMAWATFEAIGRALLPEKFVGPQPPQKLVERLAADGYVLPSEADRIRDLAKTRNQLAHGKLDLPIESADLEKFAAVLGSLSGRLKSRSTN